MHPTRNKRFLSRTLLQISRMDMKPGSLSECDGSTIVSEICGDFADTFCPRHEDSKLEITSFQRQLPDIYLTKGGHKKRRSINTVVALDDFAVRLLLRRDTIASSQIQGPIGCVSNNQHSPEELLQQALRYI